MIDIFFGGGGPQIASALKKSSKALNALKQFVDSNELLHLITSNFYSVLYFNSEVFFYVGLP